MYNLRPEYKPDKNRLTLRQIHVLDDEYKAINKQHKISKTDREQLLEIEPA